MPTVSSLGKQMVKSSDDHWSVKQMEICLVKVLVPMTACLKANHWVQLSSATTKADSMASNLASLTAMQSERTTVNGLDFRKEHL